MPNNFICVVTALLGYLKNVIKSKNFIYVFWAVSD